MNRLALGSLVTCALAAQASAQPSERVPRVALTIVSSSAEQMALVEERVASWFRDPKLTTQRAAILDAGAILSVSGAVGVDMWVVLTDPAEANVFFTVRDRADGSPRYLMVEVALPAGLDELGVERLAQIVYPSALALWAGTLESTRSEVEHELAIQPPGTVKAAPHDEPSAVVVDVGPEYGATFTGAGVSQRVGAQVGVRGARWAPALGLRAHAAMFVPRAAGDEGIEVDLAGGTAAVGVTHVRTSGRLAFTTEAGVGLEVVRYEPGRFSDPLVMPTSGGRFTQPMLYTSCGVAIAVGGTTIGIEADVRVHLVRTHYDVLSDGALVKAVTPWQVQPGVAARFAW